MRLRTRARALTLALVLGLAGRAASTPAPTPDYARALDHSLCFDRCELTDQVGGMDATLANGATCTAGEGVVLDGFLRTLEDDALVLFVDVPRSRVQPLASVGESATRRSS